MCILYLVNWGWVLGRSHIALSSVQAEFWHSGGIPRVKLLKLHVSDKAGPQKCCKICELLLKVCLRFNVQNAVVRGGGRFEMVSVLLQSRRSLGHTSFLENLP